MLPDIELIEATAVLKPVLRRLLELYQYDFTEYTSENLGEDGSFGTDVIERYYSEDSRHAFLLRVAGAWAGFVLLRHGDSLDGTPRTMDICEFFVMRKYRRAGAGEAMAQSVWGRFPGRWQIREMANNAPAQSFWRAIVGRYTEGRFGERVWDTDEWHGPVQTFDNG